MSSKLIVAILVAGGVLATTPFYLSGHFAHKALYQQINVMTQPYKDSITITNPTSQPGLYGSTYGYDVSMKLDNPQLAQLKEKLGQDKIDFHVDNQLSHGFLKVGIETRVSGQLKALFDQYVDFIALKKQDADKPLFALTSQASFSLAGDYQLSSDLVIEGFNVDTINEFGETITISTVPATLAGTMNAKTATFKFGYDNVAIKMPESTINLNQFDIKGQFELSEPTNDDQLPFGNQQFQITMASINMTGDGKEVDVVKSLDWGFSVDFKPERATLENTLSLAKIGNPQIPESEVENVEFNFTMDLGVNAVSAYYKAVKNVKGSPKDQAQALAMLANILTEDINFNFSSIKAKTNSGPLDIEGSINVAAVDTEQFTANPGAVISALKYTAQGEMPKDLLMMTGQFPPQLIDNLLQQQMIDVQGNQVLFKLTGESGHINLNDKPLM